MHKQSYFFVGVGGIGMSALAQLLHARGNSVSGVDRDASPTTELLMSRGIPVAIGHSPVPESTTVLIFSDAIPVDNPERTEARSRGIVERSYFEMLGVVSSEMKTIAVAGTHGKTTTTGMLARMLRDGGANPTAVIGSIVRDFGSNYLDGSADLFVVEACEYKDHLLHLNPEILVLTNIELDHTDFFPSLEALQESFKKALDKVPAHGKIITNPHDPAIAPLLRGVHAEIIDYTTEHIGELKQLGEFNRMNARAAKAAAKVLDSHLQEQTLDTSLAAFEGSWRRFEYKGVTQRGATVYDDYAHHPTAIGKTIDAARERFLGKKIIVVFHPHLYSRTRDLFDGFVEALSRADSVILAPIYAARETDTRGMSSDILKDAIARHNPHVRSLHSFDEMYTTILEETSESDVIITMGAGDIYKVADRLVS